MTEQASPFEHDSFQPTESHDDTVAVTDVRSVQESAREYTAGTAFIDYCTNNPEFAEAPEAKKANMRPQLAHAFIRENVQRNDPNNKLLLDQGRVSRSLHKFLSVHGASPPKDAVRLQARFDVQNEHMAVAASFSRYPEIAAAHYVYAELYEMGDRTHAEADAMACLLTAYGMAISSRVNALGRTSRR